MGQLYQDVLPRASPYMIVMTIIRVPIFFVAFLGVSVVNAGGIRTVDGKQQSFADRWEAAKDVKWHFGISTFVFIVIQGLKAVGIISSVIGSLVSLVYFGTIFYLVVKKLRSTGADGNMVKGYLVFLIFCAICFIATNQYVLKRLSTQMHFCILWLFWTVFAELS